MIEALVVIYTLSILRIFHPWCSSLGLNLTKSSISNVPLNSSAKASLQRRFGDRLKILLKIDGILL